MPQLPGQAYARPEILPQLWHPQPRRQNPGTPLHWLRRSPETRAEVLPQLRHQELVTTQR